VLYHFLDSKKSSKYEDDVEMYKRFTGKYSKLLDNANPLLGGLRSYSKHILSDEGLDEFNKLIKTRHSIRNFTDQPVDINKIKQAINIALYCPSACNRQPFKVYIVSAAKKNHDIGASQYRASQWLYIAADVDAYDITEYNDWIVSASIFAGYLSLALHAVGLGACIMRKDLVHETDYNKAVRRICNMKKTEKLILEFAVGNYADTFIAPVSRRKTVDDITTIIE
jgi:nitroreductase